MAFPSPFQANGTRGASLSSRKSSNSSSRSATRNPLTRRTSSMDSQASSSVLVQVVLDAKGGDDTTETLNKYHECRRYCRRLSLTKCNLQDSSDIKGMKRLCAIAQECPSEVCLRILELSDSGITSSSSEDLATLLEIASQTLEEFDLSHNKIKVSDRILRALQSSHKLVRINLSNISLGNDGIRKLEFFLREHGSLQEVRLAKNALGSKKDICHIYLGCKGNSQLRLLDLSDNKLNDACANTLAQLFLEKECGLQELDLSNTELDSSKKRNYLTGTGVKHLTDGLIKGNNTSLEVLKLGGNAVLEDGGKALGHLLLKSHSLTELHLPACSLGDLGVEAICQGLENAVKVPVLRHLDLTQNLLHDPAAISLARLLQHSTTLRVLKLRKNAIGRAGAEALARVLPLSLTLDELDIRENMINDQGAETLAVALSDERWKKPFHLLWVMNTHMTNTGFRRLKDDVEKRENRVKWRGFLRFSSNNGDNELKEQCQAVAVTDPRPYMIPMVRLEGTSEGTKLTIRSLEAFRDQVMSPSRVSLKLLYFLRTDIGDDGARLLADALVDNRCLTSLNCVACGLTAKGALYVSRAISQNGLISRLDLSNNPIGDTGVSALFGVLQHFPSLNVLVLRSTGLGNPAISSLSSFGHLLSLDLSDNKVTDVGAESLVRLLGSLRSSCTDGAVDVSSLDTAFRPPRLCIKNNNLTPRGVEALKKVFSPRTGYLEHTPQKEIES